MSGTGIDVAPNLSQCPVPVIPAAYTGGMPRYAPYRTHPLTIHTQSYRKGTNCVRGTHHALFVFELHIICVYIYSEHLVRRSMSYCIIHHTRHLGMYRWPSLSTNRSRGVQIPTPPPKRKGETEGRKKYTGVVRSVIQKTKSHSSISDKITPPPPSPLFTKSAHESPDNSTKHRKKNKEKSSNGSTLCTYLIPGTTHCWLPGTTAVFAANGASGAATCSAFQASKTPRQRSLAQEFGS